MSDEKQDIGTAIFRACSSGNADDLKKLLDTEPAAVSLLAETKDPDTPIAKRIAEKTICSACLKGHYDVVKCLLKAGINPNVSTSVGTPIFAAAKFGSVEIVKLLVENHAEYKSTRGGFSPLFIACVEGKLSVLSYLVKNGAKLDLFDNPPLIFTACSSGHIDIVKYLMEETQFDIHMTLNGEDAVKVDGKDTLLFTACQRNKLEMASYLVQQGAFITKTIALRFPNMITKIIQERFKPAGKELPGLHSAKLKELGLAEAPWIFFANYASTLAKVELRSNYLESLPVELFQMSALRVLDVSHNRLRKICSENVQWMCSKLSELDASHNQLSCVPSGIFSLPELTSLCLSYNILATLPGDPEDPSAQSNDGHIIEVHWSCEKVKKLDLSHNHLRALPDTFNDLRRLNTLHVSHNNLQELPPSCSWGCINLVHLDASDNNLTDLPIGASNYWMHTLERLYLSKNQLKEISRSITELSHITVLDLSSNQIQTLPPTNSWTGTRLNKLNLSHNQLVLLTHKPDSSAPSPPQRISIIERLTGKVNTVAPPLTSVMDDIPRELPVELWSGCLQSLFLQSNKIKFLPDYIGGFTGLARLDISGNPDIKVLPLKLGQLRNCWELILNSLTITNIPPHLLPGVSRSGSTKHLLAYLRAQHRNCIPYNRMKLMVVGLQGRGKTTLLSVLRDISAPLPPNVSTVGVNVSEWVVPPTPAIARKYRGTYAREAMEVAFSTWDLAGQEVYYATHQCFLSRNTLYLVVWNMEEGDKGIEYLQPWLLNIQSRAPHSPVIIVGTHYDKLPSAKAKDLREHYKQKIHSIYGKVPASYVALQKVISEEVKNCQAKEIPPVLNQKEFVALAERIPNNDMVDPNRDLIDPEELSVAAQFLHDNGVLLHYNDHLRGLNNLYFIDPIWLADMLAEVVTVPEKQAFVHNGILNESSVAFIFRDSKRFPSQFFQQYLQLLERFEIALSLGNGQRLIPSMLPVQRPILSFVEPQPVPKYDMEPSALPWTGSNSSAEREAYPVVSDAVVCIRRRYKMAYAPSGFWSRLISRLIINLKRSGLVEDNQRAGSGVIYWRRGILVSHTTGKFLVESTQPMTSELSGVSIGRMFEASAILVGDGIDGTPAETSGVDITVWSDNEDFSAMGYVVDQLDSLIDEWFPGLNDFDVEGICLVQRLVMWRVPTQLCPPEVEQTPRRSGGWNLFAGSQEPHGEVLVFSLERCAAEALAGDSIQVHSYRVRVPLTHLVPDLLLTDLPDDMKVDHSQFDFNPKDPANVLGRGGSGAVYRGKYKRETVAIKEFLTQAEMENGASRRGPEEGGVSSTDALQLFRDLRQEVSVLAELSHPNIVSLLGVSLRPMCIVIEFAPLGSLFGILDKRIDVIKSSQADAAITVPRMPGGVLGHMMSTKIALQVILALRYLHGKGIVYRDLKSDNILVWSLEPNDTVNVKLADYGISRFANPGGVKGEEGTPGYLAPEAIRRRGEDQAFDEKVDIFSFAMLLFELLTGQRPFENLTTMQELNKAVSKGDRPLLQDGNLEPSFPGMIDLMFDCWKQTAAERPSANEVVTRMCEPGFLCRKHTITRCRDHPLQKIDTIYARPAIKEDKAPKSYAIWTWAKQEGERQFSILDARKGVFNLPEKPAPGGRVYAMTATGETEKRIWIGTSQCEIQVYGYRTVGDPQCLWSFVVKDAVLSLTTDVEEGKVKRVFASLANGRLCIFSRTSVSGPSATTGDAELIPEACKVVCDNEFAAEAQDWAEPLILRLADVSKSAKCMVFVGSDRLWCGCGNNITVVDSVNLKVLQQIPVFIRRMSLVNELVSDGRTVWGVGRHSSCVMEWDSRTCALVRVYDCSQIDPTGGSVVSKALKFEDLYDPDDPTKTLSAPDQDQKPESESADPPETSELMGSTAFEVRATSSPFTQRKTRRTLRGTKPRPRLQPIVTEGHQQRQARPGYADSAARNRVLRRHHGSTRTTSMVLVDETLWVARGMGDVLVVDVSGREGHGKVLARLATEDCEKYGNRSYHKLVVVGGEYVRVVAVA
eukprot:Em0009g1006a